MRGTFVLLALLAVGCGDDDGTTPADAGPGDAGPVPDAGYCIADESDFPAPQAGQCTATVDEASGARLPVGADGMGGFITPGARRVTEVGTRVDLEGFPMKMIEVPGTDYVVVTDGAVGLETLVVVDVSRDMVVDSELFEGGETSSAEALFLGLAASSDGRRLWLSGGGTNRIYAYDLDPMTGQITPAPSRDIVVAMEVSDGYVSGIALSADGTTLVANLLFGDAVLILDAATGAERHRVALEASDYPYEVVLTPDGSTAFVSLWNRRAVVPVDVAAGTAGTAIEVEKNPEGMAISADGTRLVVANSDSDSLSVIDVAMRTVTATIDIHGETAPRGASPSAGAFGPDGRLYIVNAGDNAVDVFTAMGGSFVRQGRIPSLWYPTHVVVREDGTVLILNGKSFGSGPNLSPGTREITQLMAGSMTIVPAREITDVNLRAWEMEIATNNDRATRFNDVSCPDGAAYDFPIPRPGEGPSTVIDRVILVVRENKTHDAYFGALRDAAGMPMGNGDPTLTIVPVEQTEMVFPNTLELARQFAIGDNFFSGAEQSIQGHVWAVFGRTTDFVERTWLTTWGRSFWQIPPQGTLDEAGFAEEGSSFDYFLRHGATVSNFGELIGSANSVAPDAQYPGIVYNMSFSDVDKAEFLGRRWGLQCALRPMSQFNYVLMPNDHTWGLRAGSPTPRSMIADNDEGVGTLVDRVSHTTHWPRTVIFIIEDDPQDGGDHVDNHRAPLLVVSPWVKRGYVSSVHYNESSIYRTIQLILGIDEPLNQYWANAAPMYDLFTSTPDYTPYTVIPRRWPEEDNPGGGAGAAMSARWDFSQPDNQPGLSRMLWRHLRGTEPPWREPIEIPGAEEEGEDD